LCTPDVIHAYTNLNLAYLLNRIHGNYSPAVAWEVEGDVVCEDWEKVGCFSLTTIKQLPTPRWVGSPVDKEVRLRFAVLCAESVLHIFEAKYPSDKRPRASIEAARKYLKTKTAYAASYAAGAASSSAAADASSAYAAAYASSAYAAAAAYAAASSAAHAAAYAAAYASSSSYAAYAAAYAASSAAHAAASYAAGGGEGGRVSIHFGMLADSAVKGSKTHAPRKER
jgi:hypothetical protein